MENQKRKYAKRLLIILTRANRKIKGIRGRESINGFIPFLVICVTCNSCKRKHRHVGAGGTVMRPTKIDGPAMLFHNIKNHKGAKVLIGLLASRERVAALLGCKKDEFGKLLCDAALHLIVLFVFVNMAIILLECIFGRGCKLLF